MRCAGILVVLGSTKTSGTPMPYHHLTSEERYMLSALRKQGFNPAQIARELGRHRRTSAPTAAARAHSAINAAERER